MRLLIQWLIFWGEVGGGNRDKGELALDQASPRNKASPGTRPDWGPGQPGDQASPGTRPARHSRDQAGLVHWWDQAGLIAWDGKELARWTCLPAYRQLYL
jgi:hypothetical protein